MYSMEAHLEWLPRSISLVFTTPCLRPWKMVDASVFSQKVEVMIDLSCYPSKVCQRRIYFQNPMLTLVAGIAIMALGTLAAHPDCGLTIVPCGMNYFHAHKFRSRAVVEFGTPIEVKQEYIEKYKSGDRRSAVASLLDEVQKAVGTVTVNAPDYDTLMVSTIF